MSLTLTKADMVAQLQGHSKVPVRRLKQLVDRIFDIMTDSLEEGENVRVSSFGNFEVRDKKARMGRNPKTGNLALIAARRVVCFRAGDKLRETIETISNGA